MKFTLKQMRYFDAALRTGSIARAAQEMNISQSSITAAIDQIEITLGVSLFRRVPAKGLLPTQMGHEVGKRIESFLETARLFESDLLSLTGDPSGTLRLACYAPTAQYVLPHLLKRIAVVHPEIRIELMEGDLNEIRENMASGKVDLALTYHWQEPTETAFLPMFRAQPWAMVPKSFDIAAQHSVTLADLAELPMIMLDLPTAQGYFVHLFEAQGLTPNILHRSKSSSVLRALVSAQLGFSIHNICGPADRDGSAGYVSLPLEGEMSAPVYGVAYTQEAQKSVIVQAVLETCAQLMRDGVLDHLLMTPGMVDFDPLP